MAKITIQTGDGQCAPGQREAKQLEEEQTHRAEQQVNPLFAPPGSGDSVDVGPNYGYSRIRFRKEDEVNLYAAEQDARHAMDARAKVLITMSIVLVVVFFLTCVLPTNVFSLERTDRSIGTLAHETATSVAAFVGLAGGTYSIFGVYVMGIVATVLAGAAMGLSGGVYQGALKNALASPSTLGITNGGQLGCILYIVFLYPLTTGEYMGSATEYAQILSEMGPLEYLAETWGQFAASMVGCFAVVGIILVIATIAGRGKVSNASLVIAGQVFAALVNVVISWIRYYLQTFGDAETVELLASMQSASFTGTYTLSSVLVFAVPLVACMAVIFAMSSRLSLLAFNDEEARSMGISTGLTRNVMVAICTVMTALVVSFCGVVGMVGFLAPHIARRCVGPDFRYLLPASALVGSILVCGVHYITELSIPGIASGSTGMFTGIIGAVVFLVMTLRRRGSSSGSWL